MKNIATRISRSGCDCSLPMVFSMWRSKSFIVFKNTGSPPLSGEPFYFVLNRSGS
jgi:hypothetical protein